PLAPGTEGLATTNLPPERPPHDGHRPPVVQGRHHLPATRPRLPGQRHGRHRRLPRPAPAAGLLAGPRRHRHLAAAGPPPAPPTRRLRQRGLSRCPSEQRPPEGLPRLPRPPPPPRPARHPRAGHHPPLGPAPVVPARPPRPARQPRA